VVNVGTGDEFEAMAGMLRLGDTDHVAGLLAQRQSRRA